MSTAAGAGKVDKGGSEVELKLRVDDLACLMRIAIASGSAPTATVVQSNNYVDTADGALDRAKMVLRLRAESTATSWQGFVTAKGPSVKSADGSLSTVAEEELEVDRDIFDGLMKSGEALALLDGGNPTRRALVKAMRTVLSGAPVAVVGGFINERTKLPIAIEHEGATFAAALELDRTRFPGDQIHHEVELEVPAGLPPEVARAYLERLFERANVRGRSAPGKAKRFFQALAGQTLA